MMDRDFLWCAANLLLDEEEMLAEFCGECRTTAERGVCPGCGRETGGMSLEENTGFDTARFERLKRGETD